MPRRRRFSVWWGVVLGLALGLIPFSVLAVRTSRALDIADPLATPGPTPTSYWVFGSVQRWQRSCRLRFWGVSVG